MTSTATDIALYFAPRTPRTVFERVLRDVEFRRRIHLDVPSKISFSNSPDTSVPSGSLYAAVRKVFSTGEQNTTQLEDDRSITVNLRNDRIELRFANQAPEDDAFEPEFLNLMSPSTDRRLESVRWYQVKLGPTFDIDRALPSITAQAPDDIDLWSFHEELKLCVPVVLERIERAMVDGTANENTLVPRDIRYYERICGPRAMSRSLLKMAK